MLLIICTWKMDRFCSYLLKIHFGCTYVSAHMQGVCEKTLAYVHTCGSQKLTLDSFLYHPLFWLVCLFLFWNKVFPLPMPHHPSWPVSLRVCLDCYPQWWSKRWENRHIAFMWMLKTRIQAFMNEQKALHPLSHLPSPSFFSFHFFQNDQVKNG